MPKRLTIETFVDKSGHTFLLSNDRDFLEKKGEVIRQYCKNISPFSPLGEVCVQSFDSETIQSENYQMFPDAMSRWLEYEKDYSYDYDQTCTSPKMQSDMLQRHAPYYRETCHTLEKRYSYCLYLDPILPSFVKTTIDLSHRYQRGVGFSAMNCHSAAYISSGIFPLSNDYLPSIQSSFPGVVTVSIDNLSPGDIVTLNNKANHSFVFLDDDICFSANGCQSPLKIHLIADVIRVYSEYSVYKSAQDLELISQGFFRKDPSIYYSESLISMTRASYLIAIDLTFYIRQKAIDKIQVMIKSSFVECYLTHHATPILKKSHEALFDAMTWRMSAPISNLFKTIIPALNDGRLTIEQGLDRLKTPETWNNLLIVKPPVRPAADLWLQNGLLQLIYHPTTPVIGAIAVLLVLSHSVSAAYVTATGAFLAVGYFTFQCGFFTEKGKPATTALSCPPFEVPLS